MAFLSLNSISFSYKNTSVIKDFSLQVEEGSFTTLLGESGCGKTTLLRLISGFLEPQKGTISINGSIVNGILPDKRKIGMVFQDYALFPHLTVEQNLLYGLNLFAKNREQKEQNRTLILETAENLNLQNLLDRFPSELSGGQQQRVALGRALVLKPCLLLMDEPLSSLDTKLRIKVREELKEIQKRLKITTIYVTHDQEEALSLSDKIAVINHNSLVQYGTPEQVYFEPASHFAADFVGRANFFAKTVNGSEQEILVRPEWFTLSRKAESPDSIEGTVVSKEFLGIITRYKIHLTNEKYNAKTIICDQPIVSGEQFDSGDKVFAVISKKWEIKPQK